MLAHRFPSDPRGGVNRSKLYFFSTVMLHIKLKGMTNAVTCKYSRPYIVKFRLFHVLVLANNETWRTPILICTDTQTGLRYLLFACRKVSLFASLHICFVSFLSLFACKHARNGVSNTKFVNTKLVMASIHWSSTQRRSQNAEKLWTSKGDYWIQR